ncbi:MAG: glucose-6-phosphate 1-dehydrogenase [Candidatus Dojkabacteria bacterium]|nr:MAG: glucose-6-phosphate 1-dehydrogenase [Candidatus Dojkabacteria bacterium]
MKMDLPLVFTIFGATGDLATSKIFPGIFNLFCDGIIGDNFKIIGFARRFETDKEFRNYLSSYLYGDEQKKIEFLKKVKFCKGDVTNFNDYVKLKEKIQNEVEIMKTCPSFLYYLSLTPKFYEDVLRNIDKVQLTKICNAPSNWYRIAIEKPFGESLESDEKIEKLLRKLFVDDQIYRVDHYLGKRILHSLFTFRFSNSIFDGVWNKNFIERVELKILETEGVENRVSFYDTVGALRDVGQNHLLQMLSFVAMDEPQNFNHEEISREKHKVLKNLNKMNKKDIVKNTIRKQSKIYSKLVPNSKTETYFKILASINLPRWKGVDFVLEGGKYWKEDRKEIRVIFKNNNLFDKQKKSPNEIIFQIQPKPKIITKFYKTESIFNYQLTPYEFEIEEFNDNLYSEYYFLIYKMMIGERIFFVGNDEILEMWKFTDNIIKAWQNNLVPLEYY